MSKPNLVRTFEKFIYHIILLELQYISDNWQKSVCVCVLQKCPEWFWRDAIAILLRSTKGRIKVREGGCSFLFYLIEKKKQPRSLFVSEPTSATYSARCLSRCEFTTLQLEDVELVLTSLPYLRMKFDAFATGVRLALSLTQGVVECG